MISIHGSSVENGLQDRGSSVLQPKHRSDVLPEVGSSIALLYQGAWSATGKPATSKMQSQNAVSKQQCRIIVSYCCYDWSQLDIWLIDGILQTENWPSSWELQVYLQRRFDVLSNTAVVIVIVLIIVMVIIIISMIARTLELWLWPQGHVVSPTSMLFF